MLKAACMMGFGLFVLGSALWNVWHGSVPNATTMGAVAVLALVANPEVLAVDQDAAVVQGVRLAAPNATGAQNNTRYAYFANSRRLAVDTGGDVWVYDTLDHQIGGFSQQQGSGGGMTFSSQYGTVNLGSLPVVLRNGQEVQAAPVAAPASAPTPAPAYGAPAFNAPSSPAAAPPAGDATAIFAAIERLGDLQSKGLLTAEEFATKKSELLGRL